MRHFPDKVELHSKSTLPDRSCAVLDIVSCLCRATNLIKLLRPKELFTKCDRPVALAKNLVKQNYLRQFYVLMQQPLWSSQISCKRSIDFRLDKKQFSPESFSSHVLWFWEILPGTTVLSKRGSAICSCKSQHTQRLCGDYMDLIGSIWLRDVQANVGTSIPERKLGSKCVTSAPTQGWSKSSDPFKSDFNARRSARILVTKSGRRSNRSAWPT